MHKECHGEEHSLNRASKHRETATKHTTQDYRDPPVQEKHDGHPERHQQQSVEVHRVFARRPSLRVAHQQLDEKDVHSSCVHTHTHETIASNAPHVIMSYYCEYSHIICTYTSNRVLITSDTKRKTIQYVDSTGSTTICRSQGQAPRVSSSRIYTSSDQPRKPRDVGLLHRPELLLIRVYTTKMMKHEQIGIDLYLHAYTAGTRIHCV